MAKISISYSGITDQVNEIRNVSGNINEIANELDHIATSISNGGYWEGLSASFYSQKLKSNSSNFLVASSIIGYSADALNKCLEQLSDADRTINSMLNIELNKKEAASLSNSAITFQNNDSSSTTDNVKLAINNAKSSTSSSGTEKELKIVVNGKSSGGK